MKSPVKNWTDAKWKQWVVSLLRRGTMRFPNRNFVLNAAKTGKKINPASGRLAQHYKCAKCKKEFPAKHVAIDHIQPVVDAKVGFVDWNTFIERMFCTVDNLQVLCSNCHDIKTAKEKTQRKSNK